MKKRPLKPYEIVVLRPDTVKNKAFSGCLMVVTEPKSFGAQGYVQDLGTRERAGGQAYYRAGWDEMDETGGMTPWGFSDDDDIGRFRPGNRGPETPPPIPPSPSEQGDT